jgi:hypothetical protein
MERIAANDCADFYKVLFYKHTSQATEGKSFAKLCSYYAEHSRWIRCLLKVSSENDRDERKDVTTLTKFIFAPFVHLSGT